MIIIYRGSTPTFPLLACRVHFEYNTETVRQIDYLMCNSWEWHRVPLKLIGTDMKQNVIFCVVHGKYGDLYHRTFTGISDIFSIETKVVDIEKIISEQYGFPKLFFWKAFTGEKQINNLLEIIKPYISLLSR